MRFKFTREMIIPKGATKIADRKSDAVAYLYTAPHNGKPAAMVFFGKADKAVWRHYFMNEQQRERKITEAFESRRAWEARKAEYRKERTEFVHDYKVGDIFRTCWGYEQTNIEYFEVVEVRGKHVMLRELCQERVETGWLQGKCVPLPGKYRDNEIIRRLAQKGGIRICKVRYAFPVDTKTVGGVKVIEASHWTAYH